MKRKRSLKELTKWKDFEKKLLANPQIKKDLNYMEVEYRTLKKLIDIRLKKNISQKELAKRLKTKQPAISRLEQGLINPTIYSLSKVASALGKKLVISFK